MKATALFNSDLLSIIGWTIIHTFWQFFVLFAMLKVLLIIINNRHSVLRYRLSILAMVGAVVCSVLTFNHEYRLLIGSDLKIVNTVSIDFQHFIAAREPGKINRFVRAPQSGPQLINFLNTLSQYLARAWALGLLLYFTKLIRSGLALRQFRTLPSESSIEISERMRNLRIKMKIKEKVKLTISARVAEPMTFGFLKPIILLPASIIIQVPADQLEMILAHELAHIKRKDFLVNLAQSTLEVVYFFNPFFKIISNCVRNEREYCCDDMASGYAGTPKKMAVALTNLTILSRFPDISLAGSPVQGTFKDRVNRLLYPGEQTRLPVKSILIAFLLLAVTLAFLTKCMAGISYNHALPLATEQLNQVFTDNQANYKEQVFLYSHRGRQHEIFLVSTIRAKPLYAYLDGSLISTRELKTLTLILNRQRIIGPDFYLHKPPTLASLRNDSLWSVSAGVDSLNLALQKARLDVTNSHAGTIDTQLKLLTSKLTAENTNLRRLSMIHYQQEIKYIPIDVKLHTLLTAIIVSKLYTDEQRDQLAQLISQKQKIDGLTQL